MPPSEGWAHEKQPGTHRERLHEFHAMIHLEMPNVPPPTALAHALLLMKLMAREDCLYDGDLFIKVFSAEMAEQIQELGEYPCPVDFRLTTEPVERMLPPDAEYYGHKQVGFQVEFWSSEVGWFRSYNHNLLTERL